MVNIMTITRRKFFMPWTKEPTAVGRAIDDALATDAGTQPPASGKLTFKDCIELYDAVRHWEHTATDADGISVRQYRGAAPLGSNTVSVIVSRVDGPMLRSKSPIYSMSVARDTAVCAHYRTGRGALTRDQETELAGMYSHARIDHAERDAPGASLGIRMMKN